MNRTHEHSQRARPSWPVLQRAHWRRSRTFSHHLARVKRRTFNRSSVRAWPNRLPWTQRDAVRIAFKTKVQSTTVSDLIPDLQRPPKLKTIREPEQSHFWSLRVIVMCSEFPAEGESNSVGERRLPSPLRRTDYARNALKNARIHTKIWTF